MRGIGLWSDGTGALALLPGPDVTGADGRWQGRAPEPWLAAPGLARWRGRWLRLLYHAGLWDEAVRPLIRFLAADGSATTVPMNGALAGVGEWTGRVPDDTVAVSLSPVRGAGAFAFRLVAARPVTRTALLVRGVRRAPGLALTAIGARAIGARAEARHCLAFAALATPVAGWPAWRAAHTRKPDAFDGPPPASLPVHLVGVGEADDPAWSTTRAALAAQSWPHWRLHLDPAMPAAELGPPGEIVATIRPGDLLAPDALAQVAAFMAAHPALVACYGDEDGPAGPRLKPDFDPVLAVGGYVGEGLFRRLGALPACATLADVAALPCPADGVGHLRRLVWRRPFRPLALAASVRPPPDLSAVTAVVPTRDRPHLLAACLAGLFEGTSPAPDLVIVDNGTVDPQALRLLDEAARRPRVRVLRRPGPFNYSALCNAGAEIAETPLLLLLNNDVAPVEPDWIGRLAAWAVRPDVGAVGARLLYPDGRLQHGGVVVGMGGTALHLHHRTRDPHGYLGLLDQPRTVSAVTGAVTMVALDKWRAVGGLDADAFPVLLNDIDLCLRLAARGWRTVYEPAATLIHHESASRGRGLAPLRRHAAERRRFADRWADAIRDDPWFHPALSLTALDPALG